jgi:hypothetical protein
VEVVVPVCPMSDLVVGTRSRTGQPHIPIVTFPRYGVQGCRAGTSLMRPATREGEEG